MLKERQIESLIAPPFYWGINEVSAAFPGTFEVRPAVMTELIIDIMTSLSKGGFRQLFCISGHGDAAHNRTLLDALERGRAPSRLEGYFVASADLFARLGIGEDHPCALRHAGAGAASSQYLDIHAGRTETSAMLAERPDLVRSDIFPGLRSTDYGLADLLEWRKGGEHARAKTPDGYFGDPANATRELGTAYFDGQAALIADAIARAAHRP